MPRIDYPDEHYIDLRSDEHGLLARIVVRLLVVEGKRVRWAVVLQVRRQDGRFRDVVRYDDWHGYLHICTGTIRKPAAGGSPESPCLLSQYPASTPFAKLSAIS